MSSYTERFVMSKIITLRKWFLGDLKRFFKAFFVLTSCSRFLQVHSFFKSFFDPKLYICLWFYVQYAEDLESGFSSDVESKYKKIYEDDINPFAAFSKKVAQLGYSNEAQQIFFCNWLTHFKLVFSGTVCLSDELCICWNRNVYLSKITKTITMVDAVKQKFSLQLFVFVK